MVVLYLLGLGGSGFSFMADAAPGGNKPAGDAFGFVSDAMKSQPQHQSRR